MDVAVVRREDTGLCLGREGVQLGDKCQVKCDSDEAIVDELNAFLVSGDQGDHSFDGSEFEPGCFGDARHHVVVRFYLNRKGMRTAKFHYFLKSGQQARRGDPFYLTVVGGKRFIERLPAR